MNTETLPSTARLRRSLARRRVRELRARYPVLEWLFGRFVLTEGVLREWARGDAARQEECSRVMIGNGHEDSTDDDAMIQEVQLAALSAAGLELTECEKPTLLVVDDDQLLLRTTRRVLQARYRVLISSSPGDALELLKAHYVDVIVSDYDIPNTEGGGWLLERVSEQFPEVARILTSSVSVPREVSTSTAVERFVHKNAGLDELVQNITECLAGHRSSSSAATH